MDRRRRIEALSTAVLLLMAALAVQAATADPAPDGTITSSDDAYPGNTLVTVQSFDSFTEDNGEAMIVSPAGEVVWRFDPPDTRVFDAERIDEETVMVAMATRVPATDCPAPYRDTDPFPDHCVRNRVAEVDMATAAIGWNYTWYDAWIRDHEVHDADRLENGQTAIADMGNDRAFVVNRAGEIVWQWNASDRIGPGSDFWEAYVPADDRSSYRPPTPEADWTHLNDIDALANGNLLLSIRNFDVVVAVDRDTGAIEAVTGQPGGGTFREQHNPNHLGRPGTMLVADSVNNRIVELDPGSGDPVWTYSGSDRRLQWPRDADRLPNGNTLVVDSRNFRVLEINATGAVVWEFTFEGRRGIVYDADRMGLPEEPDDVPGAAAFPDTGIGPIASVTAYVESWASFVFPAWVGFAELFTIAATLLLTVLLGIDLLFYYREREAP